MNSRVQDIAQSIKEIADQTIATLKNISPESAQLLELRLQGHAPSLKEGVPRKEGFIERVLRAAETDDKNLMTLKDAEEILTLIFELISGRKILMLTFRYRGRKVLMEAADDLESARSNYKIAVANFYSRLHNLINFLIESGAMETDEAQRGLSAPELLQIAHKAINHLCDLIYKISSDPSSDNKYSTLVMLSVQIKILDTALELYQSLRRSYRHIDRRQQILARNIQKWQSISSHYSNATTALRSGRGQGGLRIIEKKIQLDDKEKLVMAKTLAPHFNNFKLNQPLRVFSTLASFVEKPISVNAIKEIAIESALTLEEFIPISNPAVRYAIESANAINFDGFRLELNESLKAGWGGALVNEVQKDLTRAAEQLARALTQHYGIELTPSAIEFLHHNYGVSKETLQALATHATLAQELSDSSPERSIPEVPAPNRRWLKTLEKSKSLLRPW